MSTRSTLIVLLFTSALLVAGFALWTKASTADSPTEAPASPAVATKQHEEAAATELSAPDSVVNLKAVSAPPDRAAEPARPRETPAPEVGPPPISDLSTNPSLESGQFDPIPPADREFFTSKYASSRADDRRRARETLEALFNAHKSGEEPKSSALTPEEAAAIEREIAWLAENPGG